MFPHGSPYRNATLGSSDGQALTRLHAGPEIHIFVFYPPHWASDRMALLLGLVAVALDAFNDAVIHTTMARRLGFRPLYLSVRACATPTDLADLIIGSSCLPPLTPQARRDGIPIFDGGLVNNVPTEGVAPDQGQTLVLLTRQFTTAPALERKDHQLTTPATPPAPARVATA